MHDMERPWVSVLLPVRDAAPTLSTCLWSLRRQTLERIEVVAVNDGSRDGSGQVLDRWATEDGRIRVLHQTADGLVAALNLGLARCSAPLVARMDADDVSHPRRLELQAAYLGRHPDVGVVSCLVQHFPRRGVGEGFRIYEAWLNSLRDHEGMARERFIESPIAHPSAMVRREVLVGAGGYHDPGWPEDYDLWLRLFDAGVRFAKVDAPLFFWREHGRRLTRRDPRYAPIAFLRCKSHYLARGPLATADRVVVWGAGRTGRLLSRCLIDQERVAIEAFIDIDPDKIGRRARGRPIVPPERLAGLLTPRTVVLAAVGSRGARKLIRERLNALNLTEGVDYWCVA
jgi:glycosyltransferase involved in cell wall biosynthesis